MTTEWSDAEANPLGIVLVEKPSSEARPTIQVTMDARLLARFKDKNGNPYVCAFVADKKRAFRFNARRNTYEESSDPSIKFVILRMTEELMEI